MKVICIDDEWVNPTKEDSAPTIVYGEIVTVSGHGIDPFVGNYYTFVEYGPHNYYEQASFVPLSNIDETTLERNYIKEKI